MNRIKVLQSVVDHLTNGTAATRRKNRWIVYCRRNLKIHFKQGNLAIDPECEEPIFGPNSNESSTFRYGAKPNEIYYAIFQRRNFIAWPLIRGTIFCLSLTVSECYIVYWFSVAFRRRIFSGLPGLQVLESSASSLCSPNKLKKGKLN